MDWRASNGDHKPATIQQQRRDDPSSRTAAPLADADPPAAPYIECLHDWRALSQTVNIGNIDWNKHSFTVYTELCVVPLTADLNRIYVNLGKGAQLPNESGMEGRVTVNDVDAEYHRVWPLGDMRACASRGLGEANIKARQRLVKGDGELCISIPPEVMPAVRQMRCVKLALEVVVIQPRHGVQFSCSIGRDGVLEKGAHVFTFRSSLLCSTREWLPCMDAPDQLCLWRVNVTCDAAHMAVVSGELQDVEYSSDMREKTFHYAQSVPTAAPNMGWAVGQFTPHVHTEMAEMTSFALPGLLSVVRHTVGPLDRLFEYFEELLSCRYPFGSYKQVFVDKACDEVTSYSSLTIMSVNVLYHKKIIDVHQEARQQLALAVAQQFFGCFISPAHWCDWWIGKSMSRFITSLYIEKAFGASELLFQTWRQMQTVCEHEAQWGRIVLRPRGDSAGSRPDLHCDARDERTTSPLYADSLAKKGHLVLRMLCKRLGQEPFFQVLHKILSVGTQNAERRDRPACWTHLIVSTESFFRTVCNVTGSEIPTFLEQWIYGGGHAHFQVQYTFNRKRNMIELEIRQEPGRGNGRQSYVGPLTVVVQELDGSFSHTVQIDSDYSRQDLQCHSKGRRQKKKKIPLFTGEEVEVDLGSADPDSPVLWIRVDPDLLLVRDLMLRQPNYQWEYMLKYERDVLAQLHALDRIQQFPSPQSRTILIETINNPDFFYRVRCRSAYALSTVMNRMMDTATPGAPPLIQIFRDNYGCKSVPSIPRPNNFVATAQMLQHYFLMQALPQALGRLRPNSAATAHEVHKFIQRLVHFNDNSMNRYSDDHYRAALISALSATVVPGEALGRDGNQRPEGLAPDVRATLKEVTMALNMDTLKPSFGRVVGAAALHAIYQLQRTGHLPMDSSIFWMFAQPKSAVQMRKAALTILCDKVSNVKERSSRDDLDKLLDMSVSDGDPSIRVLIPTLLATTPPFTSYNNQDVSNPVNTADLVDQLWHVVTDVDVDPRVRQLYADLYFSMYDMQTPPTKRSGHHMPNLSGHRRALVGGGVANGGGANGNHGFSLDDERGSPPREAFREDMLQ